MLRKLLACLALLTGLAAAGAPAQANAAVILTASLESSSPSDKSGRITIAAAGPASARSGRSIKTTSPRRSLDAIFRFPTVYLGSDRARE